MTALGVGYGLLLVRNIHPNHDPPGGFTHEPGSGNLEKMALFNSQKGTMQLAKRYYAIDELLVSNFERERSSRNGSPIAVCNQFQDAVTDR